MNNALKRRLDRLQAIAPHPRAPTSAKISPEQAEAVWRRLVLGEGVRDGEANGDEFANDPNEAGKLYAALIRVK